MVKYCGYTVRNEWMYQRGVDLGFPRPVTAEEKSDMILRISRDLMTETGISRCTKLRHVKTAKGIGFWCIAFASNDTLSERLPTTAPSEEKYKALKEVLQKKAIVLSRAAYVPFKPSNLTGGTFPNAIDMVLQLLLERALPPLNV
ncbi:hypothetical protein EV424DRAFT_1556233 [Suillus variegatus]|nr:hypothetical protein EV424DRAFT_1556233 [Suillus variegatus]